MRFTCPSGVNVTDLMAVGYITKWEVKLSFSITYRIHNKFTSDPLQEFIVVYNEQDELIRMNQI